MSGKIFDRMLMKELDVQGLLKVAKANSIPNGLHFNLDKWQGPNTDFEKGYQCGTSGCLIGHFCHVNREDDLKIEVSVPTLNNHSMINCWETIGIRFSLTILEANWLFSNKPIYSQIFRNSKDQKSAVKRLYKFLYYKMRKAELLADYEVARKSYDTGISKEASEADYQDCQILA